MGFDLFYSGSFIRIRLGKLTIRLLQYTEGDLFYHFTILSFMWEKPYEISME